MPLLAMASAYPSRRKLFYDFTAGSGSAAKPPDGFEAMKHSGAPLGLTVYVFTACSKSLWDALYLRRDGTFDSIFYGRGSFSAHPIWCCVNILLDAGSVIGSLMFLRSTLSASAARSAGTARERWKR